MTEAAPGTLFLDAEHAVGKAGSAGVPHFFSDVRVVRPDLTPVGTGEVGEVVVRGPHVMPGLLGAAGGDRRVLHGRLVPQRRRGPGGRGRLRVHRRPHGGYDPSPAARTSPRRGRGPPPLHPDVVECAVIGVPDQKWGEVPRAVVVLREGAAVDPGEILASLAGRLARYKIPKSVVVADELPRTASGKILKPCVRERLRHLLAKDPATDRHRQRPRRTEEARRERPRHERVDRGHPGTHRHLRRRHRRPPVDRTWTPSARRRARSAPPSPTVISPSPSSSAVHRVAGRPRRHHEGQLPARTRCVSRTGEGRLPDPPGRQAGRGARTCPAACRSPWTAPSRSKAAPSLRGGAAEPVRFYA